MKIVFEQVFYGRGERGYGILGISPGCRPLALRVQSLCGCVGTPNSDYGGESFLISAPECDSVIMLCGRRGMPDSMGRATLFFHALIADKESLAHAKADAFSLFSQGAFADKMPIGDIGVLSIDVTQGGTQFGAANNAGTDAMNCAPPACVIRAEKPLPDLVHAFVGERANVLSWTTFAFQAISDFDVQVLPPRVSCPRNMNEYDASGMLIRSAYALGNSVKSEPPMGNSNETFYQAREQAINAAPTKSNAMLTLSIALNVVLAFACVYALFSREPKKTHETTSGSQTQSLQATSIVTNSIDRRVEVRMPPSEEEIAKYRKEGEERFRSSLSDVLRESVNSISISISAFEENDLLKRVEDDYKKYPNDPDCRKQKLFFDNIKDNITNIVAVINDKILKGKTP